MRVRDVQLSLEEIEMVVEEAKEQLEGNREAQHGADKVLLKLRVYAAQVARETFVVQNGTVIG